MGFDTIRTLIWLEAADLIVRTIRGLIRPVMAFREFFWSAACQVTAHPPIDEAFCRVHEAEKQPGMLSITLATGFPWADVPNMEASVIAVADGDVILARKTAEEIGDWVRQHRERWHRKPLMVAEALALGEREGCYPVVLVNMGPPVTSIQPWPDFLDE